MYEYVAYANVLVSVCFRVLVFGCVCAFIYVPVYVRERERASLCEYCP